MQPPRSLVERIEDTRALLDECNHDVWVATGGPAGAHLVPLSYAWQHGCVLIACEASSRTAANLMFNGRARMGFGTTRDVVMIDAVVARSVPVSELSTETANAYARQAGWDPTSDANNLVVHLRPSRIQAWRESNEIVGRTLMRDSTWLAEVS